MYNLLPLIALSKLACGMAARVALKIDELAVGMGQNHMVMDGPLDARGTGFGEEGVKKFWDYNFQDFVAQYHNYFFGARFPVPAPTEAHGAWKGCAYSGVAGQRLSGVKEFRISKLWRHPQTMKAVLQAAMREDRNIPEGYSVDDYIAFVMSLWGISRKQWMDASTALGCAESRTCFLPLPPVPDQLVPEVNLQPEEAYKPDLKTDEWPALVAESPKLKLWREVYLNGPHPFAADRHQDRTLPYKSIAKTELVDTGKHVHGFVYIPPFPAVARIAFARMWNIYRGTNNTALDLFKYPDPEGARIPSIFFDKMYEHLGRRAREFDSESYHQRRMKNIVKNVADADLVGFCEFYDEPGFTEQLKAKGFQKAGATTYRRGNTIAMYYKTNLQHLKFVSAAQYKAVDRKSVLLTFFEYAGGLLCTVMLHNRQDSAPDMIEPKFAELRLKIYDLLMSDKLQSVPGPRHFVVMGDMNVHIEDLNIAKLPPALLHPLALPKVQPEGGTPKSYRTDLKSGTEVDYMFTSFSEPTWSSSKNWKSLEEDNSDHVMLKNYIGITGRELLVASHNVMDPKTLDAFDPKQIEPNIVEEVQAFMGNDAWHAMKQRYPQFTLFLEGIVKHTKSMTISKI